MPQILSSHESALLWVALWGYEAVCLSLQYVACMSRVHLGVATDVAHSIELVCTNEVSLVAVCPCAFWGPMAMVA
jgi:hypothetical protein